MTAGDVQLIALAAAAVLAVGLLLFKEFALLCFDEQYAAAQGWPVLRLDLSLMALVVGVTVIGLQSVGLLLVVAMLITPSAAARFWTDHFGWMVALAATIGGTSALLGVAASALVGGLAGGPIIVLVGSSFFVASLLVGTRRGVLRRLMVFWRLRSRVGRHDLLRAMYECVEQLQSATQAEMLSDLDAEFDEQAIAATTRTVVPMECLLTARSWTPSRLRRLLSAARREGLIEQVSRHTPCAAGSLASAASAAADGTRNVPAAFGYRLTRAGARQARRVVRNHRLWEMYLIHYADIAPSHVDRDADQIEHVLEPELIEELEGLLADGPRSSVPPSPHALAQR
jgi:manganese/zinc/iron transport system permease protein